MAKTDAESVAATLKRAQEAPDDTGGASAPLPQMFGFPTPPGEEVVDNLPPSSPSPDDTRRVGGVPKYNLEAHLQRFIIGQEVVGTNERGMQETAERDDSKDYERLVNDILNGAAILRWEEKQHLRDGTLVISMCYFTVKPKKEDASEKNEPLYDTRS